MNRRAAALAFFLPLGGAALLFSLCAVLPFDPIHPVYMLLEAGASGACAIAALLLSKHAGVRLFPPKGEHFAFPAPCPRIFCISTALAFLVALNNLPALALLSGDARVSAGFWQILLFACTCLATASFEEFFFRGVVFSTLLRRTGGLRGLLSAVFLSSAVFGAAHLLNLTAGASAPETLLQVGYSFLVGCVAALLFLFSRSIVVPILFHALYNFGGLLVPRLGYGDLFDTPTVILTVFLALLCAVFMCLSLKTPEITDTRAQILGEN